MGGLSLFFKTFLILLAEFSLKLPSMPHKPFWKLLSRTSKPQKAPHPAASAICSVLAHCWAEALLKIARMTLTIKRDGNWSSFQLANSALPLSVTSSAIAPSARMRPEVRAPAPARQAAGARCSCLAQGRGPAQEHRSPRTPAGDSGSWGQLSIPSRPFGYDQV